MTLPIFRYTCAMNKIIHVIGGGLAGSEAAFAAASCGVRVLLHEMRPGPLTDGHATGGLASLVCSTSAPPHPPPGRPRAVHRHDFSAAGTEAIQTHPLMEICREEIGAWPPDSWQS